MTSPAPQPQPSRPISPVWALLVLAFSAPLVFTSLKQLRMVNDVTTWLPGHDAGKQVLDWTHQHFEPENRFLLTWDSSSLADARVPRLVEKLTPPDARTEDSDNPLQAVTKVVAPYEALSAMLEQGVDHETAVQRLSGVLVGKGLLKIRLSPAGREQQATVEAELLQFANEKLDISAVIVPPVSGAGYTTDKHGETLDTGDSVAALAALEDEDKVFHPDDWRPNRHDFQVRWTGISPDSEAAQQLIGHAESLRSEGKALVERAYFQPGAPVALSVSVAEQGDERLRATINAVKQAAEECGVPAEELRLGGSPIGRVELNRSSGLSVWNPAYPWWQLQKRSPLGLSALVGTLLAFVLLRSVRLAVLVLATSLYTAIATVALIPVFGQTMNTVLMVMPNLLLVLTMSGAIHVANYWRHAACHQLADPVRSAVRMAFEPCALASVTTAIGLASLLTSVLNPVRQFGLFSAIGCLLSIVMVLWVFPALLQLWPGRPAPLKPPHEDIWHRFGLFTARHSRAITFTCLALFVASAWGLHWFRTETKVIRYFPDTARIVQDYQFLEDELAGIVGVDVLIRFPPEKRRSRDDDTETDTSSIAARPKSASLDLFQRIELVRSVQQKLEHLEGVSGALSLADFRKINESSRKNLRSMQIAKKIIFETRSDETREFVTHAQTPLSVVLNDVPLRIEIGAEVWRIRAQCSALTDRQYAGFLDEINGLLKEELRPYAGVDHVVTGMVPLFLRTQEAVLESLINSFGLAFIMIAGVMMYLLRGFLAGTITMLPNILPVGLVFGLISWYGVPVDIGTMITASVALGIAIDGTLHLLTWFRDGLQKGLSKEESIARGLAHCAPAMWQTSTAISLGLLMLGFADLLLISRFGWLMAALIMAALLADLVYLPSLLAGGLGTLIQKSVRRTGLPLEAKESSTTPATTAATTR
ncbi:MAG: efflux RND transporter permease subunit [Planctomycetaceae bacterium]